MSGRPGPGGARAARRHADVARRRAPTRRASTRSRRTATPTTCAAAERAARATRAAPLVHRRRQPLGRRRARRAARGSPRRRSCRSHARSATRTSSTTGIRNYAGDVGIGINPKLAARVRDADVLLVIGERLGEMTTSRLHAARRAGAAADADPRASGCRRARPRLPAGARRSPRRRAPSSLRSTPLPRGRNDVGGPRARAHDEYERGARRAPCPALSTCGRSCAGSTSAFPTTRSSPTARATTRRGCIACSAIGG